MSDVPLATRYSPANYPIVLENLAKRYNKNGQPVHYTDAGYGDVSEDQANSALRFFAEIDFIDNPKGANYEPPEPVVTWMLKMGRTREEAKDEVFELLMKYEVFNETVFVLQDGEQKIDSLAEQVGGLVGIDAEEISDMKRTIRVFVELGFLELNSDGIVSIPKSDSAHDIEKSDNLDELEPSKTGLSLDEGGEQSFSSPISNQSVSDNLSVDLNISIDATEMDVDDLKKKLRVIQGVEKYAE